MVSKSLISAFLIVNLINIIPFSLFNPKWFLGFSSLIVDTSSLLFIGFSINKFKNFLALNDPKYSDDISKKSLKSEDKEKIISKLNQNLIKVNKFCFGIFITYLVMSVLQIFVIARSINIIDFNYNNNIYQLNKLENKRDKTFENSNGDINSQANKFNDKEERIVYLKNLRFSEIFTVTKNSIRILILSLMWGTFFLYLSRL